MLSFRNWPSSSLYSIGASTSSPKIEILFFVSEGSTSILTWLLGIIYSSSFISSSQRSTSLLLLKIVGFPLSVTMRGACVYEAEAWPWLKLVFYWSSFGNNIISSSFEFPSLSGESCFMTFTPYSSLFRSSWGGGVKGLVFMFSDSIRSLGSTFENALLPEFWIIKLWEGVWESWIFLGVLRFA